MVASRNRVPGALGLVLRKMLYPRLLGACGRNVVFGQNVVLRHPHKIRIGDNVVIDDNCLLDAKGDRNGGIAIGDGVFVGRNSILSCKDGDITLDDGANIGFNCEIFSASHVRIGREPCWPPTATSSAATTTSAIRPSRCWSSRGAPPGCGDRRPARGSGPAPRSSTAPRSVTAPSSAPARSCAIDSPAITPIAVGMPRE